MKRRLFSITLALGLAAFTTGAFSASPITAVKADNFGSAGSLAYYDPYCSTTTKTTTTKTTTTTTTTRTTSTPMEEFQS